MFAPSTHALATALELTPLIAELRNETETTRRIAERVVERLRETRLCRMAIVRDLDGLELQTVDSLDVFEALAGAEASVGWIVWNNYLPGLFARYLV